MAHLLSNMARYAVFGDSYVRRLGEFGGNYDVEGEVECFGVGGMRTDSIPNWLWQKMEEFAPTHVFIHLGGNDISSTSSPREIANRLLELRDHFLANGVRKVWVGEIMPRGRFGRSPGLTGQSFEKQRKSINQILHRQIGPWLTFFFMHAFTLDGKNSPDYSKDMVHLSPSGMTKYQAVIRRSFIERY